MPVWMWMPQTLPVPIGQRRSAPSPGATSCHSILPSNAIDRHSLGIYTVVMLPLLSFSVKMTMSLPAIGARGDVPSDCLAADRARRFGSRSYEHSPIAIARKVLGWSKRCKLAHAFLWKYSYKRLKLAQVLGQPGIFLTRWAVKSFHASALLYTDYAE
jgi:hypothetical protein